jgi:hypothetical protein
MCGYIYRDRCSFGCRSTPKLDCQPCDPASKQGDVQTLVILMIEWFDMVFRRITDQTVIRDACGACEDSCEEGDERRERVMLLRRSGSEWEALHR